MELWQVGFTVYQHSVFDAAPLKLNILQLEIWFISTRLLEGGSDAQLIYRSMGISCGSLLKGVEHDLGVVELAKIYLTFEQTTITG